MNDTKHVLALVLCALLLLGTVACGQQNPPVTDTTITTTEVTTTPPVTEAPLPDIVLTKEYKVVRPDEAEQSIVEAVKDLTAAIQKGTGLAVAPGSDWYNTRAENYTFPITEILVGATNRPETAAIAKTLRWDDYVITAEKGKLVILGGSDEATLKAITYFMNKFASTTTFTPTELYRFEAEYEVEDVLIGNRSITDYTLVYPHAERKKYVAAAETINTTLRKLSGITLPIVSDKEGTSAYELQLGPVNRDGVTSPQWNDPTEWRVTSTGSAVRINGGSAYAVSESLAALLAEAMPQATGAILTLNISDRSGNAVLPAVALEAQSDVRIMSSNILFEDSLSDRVPLIADYYIRHLPDLIGMQEVNSTGEDIFDLVSDFYGVTNTQHDSSTKHSYTPILYRKDKYNLIASGSYLYNSRATDTKSMSWAVVENKQTGQKLALCNTHSALIMASYNLNATNAVEGEQWRTDNVRQLLERVDRIRAEYGNIPVFITGDFNSNATTTSIKTMKESLPDSADIATVSQTKGINSYHKDPGKQTSPGLPIDFVFVTDDVVEVRTHCIDNSETGIALSDHCPVYIDVKLK